MNVFKKKVVSFLLALVMLMSLLPMQAFAAETTPEIEVGDATVVLTGSDAYVTVPVEIKNNPGFGGMDLSFGIPSGWTISAINAEVDAEDISKYTVFCSLKTISGMQIPTPFGIRTINEADGSFIAAHSANIGTSGYLCWITYSVPADTAAGEYALTVTPNFINTAIDTGTDISGQFTFTSGTVTVKKPGISLNQTTVVADGTNGATVEATVIDATGADVTASANLTVSPADSGVRVSGSTITVDATAKAGTYTVSDGTYSANLTVNRESEAVAAVTVSPASATVARPKAGEAAATQTFTATAYNQYGEAVNGQTFQWTTTGGQIADGVLTVDNAVKAGTYTVTATVSGVSGTAAVTVSEEHNKFPTIVVFEGIGSDSVTVTAPATGETVLTYTATVYDQYDDLMPADRNYSTKYVAGRNITIDVDNDQNPVVFTVTIPAGCGTRENTLEVEDTAITLYVKDIEFAFGDAAYTVNADRTYGKTWGELITIGGITATLNGTPVAGEYSLSVDETVVPAVGEYRDEITILFNGGGYTNVVVDTVTYVKVKEAALTYVTENVADEPVYIVNDSQNLPEFTATTVDGSAVTVTYGAISGAGASYFDYDAANGTIKVKDGTTDEADGQTATIQVTLTAPNHTSVERTITVKATKKNQVAVTFGDAAGQTYIPGGYKLGEQFDAASVPAGYSAAITYSYNGQTYTYAELCDVTVTEAGNYTVTAYYEDYSNKGSATATFVIDKASVVEPAAQTGLVYDGTEQTGVEIDASALYALADGSSNKGTNADEYTTNLVLKDAANYKWADGSDGVVEWTIARKPIAIPTAVEDLVYTGAEQTGVASGEGYTISGNVETDAGSYKATATPDGNHIWTGGNTAAVEIAWSIARKEITAANLSEGTLKVTKVYDGTTSAGSFEGALSVSGVNGEKLWLSVTSVGEYPAANKGQYSVVAVLDALQDDSGKASNYQLPVGLTTYEVAAEITAAGYSYTVADQQIKVGGGLDKLTYPETANGIGSEVLGGTFGWYTDAGCTAAATDAAVNTLTVGTSKTLYWKFAPSDANVNYDITPKTGSITVTIIEGDPQNASFAAAELTKTYGDDAFTNVLTVKSGETDITSAAAGRTTYTSSDSTVATVNSVTGEVTILKSGTTTITANVAKVEGEYAAGSASYTLTVEQKLLDFGLENITVSKVYDGTASAAEVTGSVTFNGVVAGDQVAITAVAGDYADKNVGNNKTVPVTLSLSGADAGKYKLAFTTINYTTASITVSDAVTDATNKNQNVVVGVGSFAKPVFTGIGGEDVEGTLTYSYDGATDKAAIESKLAALTKGSTAVINYSFVASGNYEKTVEGTITVTMVDILFFVGGAPATVDNAVTIKENPAYGDNWLQIVTLNTITASVNGEPVYGDYTLEQSGKPASGEQTFRVLFNDGARYNNVVVVEGTVTVAKKAAAVPTAVTGLVYTGGFHTGVNFDNLMVRVQQGSVSPRQDNAGTFNTTLELIDPANTYWVDRDVDAADASSPRVVEWSIAPKAVTVTPDAGQSKVYGEDDPVLTYTTDLTDATLNTAFEQAVNGSLSRVDGKNVGSYAIELGSLSAGGNFVLTLSGTVNFSIEKKNVTISGVTAENKVYDGNTVAAADSSAAVIDGKVAGDDLVVTIGSAAFADKNVGNGKVVTFAGFELSGNDAGNYNLTAQPAAATADIAAKEVAVVWTNTALIFNGSAQAPTAAVPAGIVDGDSVPLTVTGQQTNVGSYNAAASTTNGNYALTNANTDFAIGKAAAPSLGLDGSTTYKYTVTGEKYIAITGIPADAGSVSYSVGAVSGQASALDGAPSAANGQICFVLAPDAGDAGKTVSFSVTVAMGNYEDANVTVEIDIVERDVPVLTVEDITLDYTGTALTDADIVGTAKFNGADVAGSWSWFNDVNNMINAGNYMAVVKFTPADSANYTEVTYPIMVVVNKVKVPVPSAVTGLVYNTAEQTGVVDGEYYSMTGNTGINAGDYTATVTLDDSANYEWASAFEGTIQWSIAKAKSVGTPTFTKISVAGKTLADVTVDLSGMTPAEGTIKWVDANGNELASTTKIEANKVYTWVFTPADTANYEAISNTVVLYAYYVYIPSTPDISTEETKNEDGSTTTTVTNNETGTVTETTENLDGSTNVVETKKDGTVTETNTTADGVIGSTVTNAEGKVTEVTAKIPAEAAKSETPVTVPIEVSAADSAEEAVEIVVTMPKKVETVTVEIPVADVTPGTVVVIVNEDGTEEVVKKTNLTEAGVAVILEGSSTVKVVENSKTFTDVKPDSWYAAAVDFVSSRELYNGVGNDHFNPSGTMTRGMLVTVLHRMEDEMEHNFDGSYHDVKDGLWYTDAVHWASEHKIVDGYGNGAYGPDDYVTREQMITLVFRYLTWMGLDTSVRGDLSVFVDSDKISSWAVEAMQWGVGMGIIKGIGDDLVDPESGATRAQVAVFMQRVIDLMA